jgi:hypothetical protein
MKLLLQNLVSCCLLISLPELLLVQLVRLVRLRLLPVRFQL